jgi:hypothetical protein
MSKRREDEKTRRKKKWDNDRMERRQKAKRKLNYPTRL